MKKNSITINTKVTKKDKYQTLIDNYIIDEWIYGFISTRWKVTRNELIGKTFIEVKNAISSSCFGNKRSKYHSSFIRSLESYIIHRLKLLKKIDLSQDSDSTLDENSNND